MLLTVQLPIVDIRPLLESDKSLIASPKWPLPRLGSFIRNTGHVHSRFLGGLPTWIGEGLVCNAKNALRFKPGLSSLTSIPNLRIKCAFRRFFFDGGISGKYEIGFEIKSEEGDLRLSAKELGLLISEILNVELIIGGEAKELSRIKSSLRDLYLSSTTYSHALSHVEKTSICTVGAPLLFFEINSGERVEKPKRTSQFDHFRNQGVDLASYRYKFEGNEYRVWILSKRESAYKSARELRLTILRLNSLREGLWFLFDIIQSGEFVPESGSSQSKNLQNYLRTYALRFFEEPYPLVESEVLEASYQLEKQIEPSFYYELLRRLNSEIDIRPTLSEKIEVHINKLIGIYNMSKTENTNVHVENNEISGKGIVIAGKVDGSVTFSADEISSESLDCQELFLELKKLFEYCKAEAETSEQLSEVQKILEAKSHAENNDEKSLRNVLLSGVSSWTFKTIKDLGLSALETIFEAAI